VGLANVGIIEREGLVERAATVGARFLAMLHRALDPLPQVGEVRGLGMMAAVELVDPNATGSAYYDNAVGLASRAVARCVQAGAIPRRVNNVVCLAPPLISTEDQLQRMTQVLAESIQAESRAS
jgi:adenosylmethionine-8-amino-7-oxononanoate aminotransferase